MLGQLPNLFGKAFAIGFFLPAAVLAAAAAGILAMFGELPVILTETEEQPVLGTTLALAITWLISVVLMALNRSILRILQGYGDFNPLKVFKPIQLEEFQQLNAEISTLGKTIDEAKAAEREPDRGVVTKRAGLLLKLATKYPDEEAWLLPTALGNIIRAFQVYSRVIYGLEGIQGWSRLTAVIPEDYRLLVEDSKAQLDFWINLCVGGAAIAVLYWILAARTGSYPHWWLSLVALAVCWVGHIAAPEAALAWGALVKSAFDLYRGDLCRKLGLQIPATTELEREMWTAFSQVTIYRSRIRADELTRFRSVEPEVTKDE